MSEKKSDIVKSYLREHPDAPNRTIATYLYERYPGVWPSYNAVENAVRYYRGKHGKQNKKMRAGKEEFPKIPKPVKKRKKTVKLRDKGRWLILSDLHVPYHDEKAVETAIRRGIDKGCEHLLLNGDALDAYQQSCWVKDPNLRNTDKEIETLKCLIKELAPYFPGHKVYKVGNHEARIENYMFMNAPKMIGMTDWDLCDQLNKHLDLGDDWTMIDSKQLFMLGKLNGYHGHELPRGLTNPVSVGRGIWLRTKQSGFAGHWHSTSTQVESNGSKTRTWVCFSVGCLCDLHPNYAPVNGWNHGFAMVDLDSRGNFSEMNHRIVDGEIW